MKMVLFDHMKKKNHIFLANVFIAFGSDINKWSRIGAFYTRTSYLRILRSKKTKTNVKIWILFVWLKISFEDGLQPQWPRTWSSVLFQLDQMIFKVFGVMLWFVWKSSKKNNSIFCCDRFHFTLNHHCDDELKMFMWFHTQNSKNCHIFSSSLSGLFVFVVFFFSLFKCAHIVDDCHLNDMLTIRWIILEFMVRD